MAKRPLQNSTAVNVGPVPSFVGAGQKKTIEEVYQKKTQLEHILLRPDTYVGSIEKHTQTLWVYENDKMVNRPVTYVPGLYKIFDEILVNSADNKQRDPSMDSLKVVIDVEGNCISVFNNGDGVPVEIHQEEKVYVPELIFGHLLTSSNYDDTQKKTTGGRNGYGAKLTNIFSTEFVIETADGRRQKKYKQVFSDNMGKKSEPIITKCKPSENWTMVSFKPDLAKFNMTYLEEDVVALMKKRVLDMAGCLGKTVKVELNGQRVPVKSFQDYVDLYLKSTSTSLTEPPKRYHAKANDRWEIVVTLSEGGQFQQVSFVNGIATTKGGTHVDHITNQITNYVMNAVNKKNKNANVKAHNVKNYLWVFINALIDNPAFDSQTKETLTIRQSSFGSACELTPEFLKNVATKSGIMDSVLSWVTFKQSKDLKKTDGAKTEKISGIEKLEDAICAGGKNSDKCTLILTEGDSAKALAMAGLGVVGRDFYGVFPLRGKLLNVREATSKQITENKEIQYLKQILGLQQGKEYNNIKPLRYGHLMIMTDQDYDGSHIKGLLINFIHSFWPSLLKVPSFLVEFITPIVKATHKTKKNVLSFYTMPEYESWRESLRGQANTWTIKYYKGLGTSTSEEGREYFQLLDNHKKEFVWQDDHDGEAIELAFSKKKIEERKNWLRQFEPGTHLDQTESLIKYSDFVNKELILFSVADLQRSIPSIVDGLKPGQRKILFCSFKRPNNFTHEAKVSQFSGFVSENSAYHHGEQSLASTIIGMAQDFVGSNNINLLLPNGQFGTRNHGGKDHASSRYIFTKLSNVTRFLFPKDDDRLLNYLSEEGQSIEPTWFVPIIPMVLVNGSEGIGTGWSSYIPNYNPRDVIANVRRLLDGEALVPMHPWYRGFKGTIEKTGTREGGNSYTISGIIEEVNETMLRVTELPVRRWTNDYKEFLDSVTRNDRDKEKVAKDTFIEQADHYSDDKMVSIDIHLTEDNMMLAQQEGLKKKFKITTTVSTSNMHLFDAKGMIKRYDTPEQILEDFFPIRLEFYEKRKKILLESFELDLLKLDNKVRFILAVVSGEIIVSNRRKVDLFHELQEKGFAPFPKKTKSGEPEVAGAETEENAEADSSSTEGGQIGDYEYLLALSIGTLTIEKVEELCNDRDKMNKEVEYLRKATSKSLWLKDLDALERELDVMDKNEARAEEVRKQQRSKANNGAKPKVSKRMAPKVPRKNNKKTTNSEAVEESMDTSPSSSMTEVETKAAVKPKGKAAPRKVPAKKQVQAEVIHDDDVEAVDDDDEEVLELKERLAAYNLESSPDRSEAMETEAPQLQAAKKKEPKKRAAAQKKTTAKSAVQISDDDDKNINEDEESPPKVGKKGGRKPNANSKTTKAPPASKKQPAKLGQKLLTQMLQPAENSGISPEKKVRKMRESPFNKKSGSILGRVNEEADTDSESGEEMVEVMQPRARSQRANRPQVRYVLSDSDNEQVSEDSDFQEDED